MNTRYDLNMDVPPREALRLLYVSKSRFDGDWNSVPHTHSCTEVFYCVSGRGQFNVEGKLLDVMPDDMVIVNPRVQHTELSYQAYPLEYIVLGIEGIEILFDQKDHGYTMLKCSDMREDLLMSAKLFMSVARFIVQYRITILLKSTPFVKLPAIRFHILTSSLKVGGGSPFSRGNTAF